MQSAEVLQLYERLGLFCDGHYVYTSGRHGRWYANKEVIYSDPLYASLIGAEMARRFVTVPIDVVAGPERGGIVLTQWTAHHLRLMTGRRVRAAYAEKVGGGFQLRRGYDQLVKRRNVLVLDDILLTGGSGRKVVDLVRATGGAVVGFGALLNRGGVTAGHLGNPPIFTVLADVSLESWEPSDCPLCQDGVPIDTELGKGHGQAEAT